MTETNTKTYVLGVDPGGTTGLAIAMFDGMESGRPHAIWSDQLPWDEASDMLAKRLQHLSVVRGARVIAVGEKFVISPKSAQRGQTGIEDTMGMLGVLRREARLAGIETADLQKSADAKRTVSDQILRNLKLYMPGMKHANDAYRHCVLLANKRGYMSARWMMGHA